MQYSVLDCVLMIQLLFMKQEKKKRNITAIFLSSLFNKLTQSAVFYPIKHYTKSSRNRKPAFFA